MTATKKLSGWLAAIAAALAAIAVATHDKPKPGTPGPVTPTPVGISYVRAHVCEGPCLPRDEKLPGAHVAIEGSDVAGDTGGSGDVTLGIARVGSVTFCATLERFERACASVTLPGTLDVNLEMVRSFAPVTRVRTDGRFFVNDAGTFRPVWTSALYILPRSPEERAAVLDEDAALGFNGIRVFAGELPGRGQTAASARELLPGLLTDAAARGLYVYVSAITESGTGYDVEAHLRSIAASCAAAVNCVLEVANEIEHPTQSSQVHDFAWLRGVAQRSIPAGVPWSLGAASVDEPDGDGKYAASGGTFDTAHLDRGRDKPNQIRRLREIAGISEGSRKPAMSGEPIGAAEQAVGGKRESDPAFFFAMGALCRGFEIGCVFHSQDGLDAHVLGPNQRACAEAFLAGWRSLETGERLTFKNAGWADSPIGGANFEGGVVRAYTFVAGNAGYTVLVGLTGDPGIQWKNGWRQVRVVAERPSVRVLEVTR